MFIPAIPKHHIRIACAALRVTHAVQVSRVGVSSLPGVDHIGVIGTQEVCREDQSGVRGDGHIDPCPRDPPSTEAGVKILLDAFQNVPRGVPDVEGQCDGMSSARGRFSEIEASGDVKREAIQRDVFVHKHRLPNPYVPRTSYRAVIASEPAARVFGVVENLISDPHGAARTTDPRSAARTTDPRSAARTAGPRSAARTAGPRSAAGTTATFTFTTASGEREHQQCENTGPI